MLFQWQKSAFSPDVWLAEAELPNQKALIRCTLSHPHDRDVLDFGCTDITSGYSICGSVMVLKKSAGRCDEVRLADAEEAIKEYFTRIIGVAAELFKDSK